MPRLLALALLFATPVTAQTSIDAAHREDQRQTQDLNRRASEAVTQRTSGNAAAEARYRAASARYRQQLAEWRARVADCQRGIYAACD